MSDYRKGVGIVLFKKGAGIFAAERIKEFDKNWQMPQGGIDEGENVLEAALRELKEETGVSSVDVLGESKDFISYDLPEDLMPKYWKGKYVGQTQKWFLCEFLGDDSEIDLNTHHNPEFKNWKWVGKEFLLENIVSFKQELYLKVFEEFIGCV
jgi:putative (di)nucleoside polyphosphate hydrolase